MRPEVRQGSIAINIVQTPCAERFSSMHNGFDVVHTEYNLRPTTTSGASSAGNKGQG